MMSYPVEKNEESQNYMASAEVCRPIAVIPLFTFLITNKRFSIKRKGALSHNEMKHV